jgi:hypothetical protein
MEPSSNDQQTPTATQEPPAPAPQTTTPGGTAPPSPTPAATPAGKKDMKKWLMIGAGVLIVLIILYLLMK